jgi:putative ABC transport system permease protein
VSFEFATNVAEEGLPPQRYGGSFVSSDVFDMVGRTPALGRAFRPEDDADGAPSVAIIAHSVWQSRYGGDRSVIGRMVRINDVPTTIIGVMPEGFHFPFRTEVWIPAVQASGPSSRVDANRGTRTVLVLAFGRLADGARLTQAQAELDAIAGRLARDYPGTNEGISAALEPIDVAYWGSEFGLRQILLVVMAAVSLVLLIACVNVSTLLLARAVHRSREVAIRYSLGASRARLVRQLVVESLLLAVIAAGVGFLLAVFGVQLFTNALTDLSPEGPRPFWWTFPIDARVWAFLAGASVATTLLFGLAPALHLTRMTNEALKDGGRGATSGRRAHRWTAGLLVSQLALTLVLLSGTGLLVCSFLVVYQAGRVLDSTNVVTMEVALSAQKYPRPAQIKQFFQQLDERLTSIPALSAVTVASDIPMMTVINGRRQLTIDGRAPDPRPPMVGYLYIGPRYFETLKLQLLQGREFTDDDGAAGREAAIINQRFASMFFPDADPIGRRIRLVNAAAPNAPRPWFTIVGVAPTVPQLALSPTPEPVGTSPCAVSRLLTGSCRSLPARSATRLRSCRG